MSPVLKDKVAIITGASRGLGKASLRGQHDFRFGIPSSRPNPASVRVEAAVGKQDRSPPERPPGVRVPNPNGTVIADGGDQAAIRTETYIVDFVGMSLELEAFTGIQVPDACDTI